MSRVPRFVPPGSMVEVTTRTVGARFLLRPCPMLNERILGIVGRGLHLYPVDLHAFVFLSNHWHALATVADAEVLARFLQYVNANVAKATQEIYGWEGPVWQRRAQVIVVADDGAAEARLRYILAHGTKEGLVADPRAWPGVTCARTLAGEEAMVGIWTDRARAAALERAGRVAEARHAAATRYAIELAPLPRWAAWSSERRQRAVRALLADIIDDARARGTPPLGAVRITAQDPFDAPTRSKRGPAPVVHAAARRVRELFRAARRAFVDAYRAASALVRLGRTGRVPPFAFPPRAPLVRADANAPETFARPWQMSDTLARVT